MEKPFISIIIPALNEEHFLPNLLETLAKQSERNFEVIVVDGRSKDKTVEKAKLFTKILPKLTIVIADYANLSYQRNLGAKRAKGDWLVFMDADNVVFPYTIARLYDYIESHDPQFFTTWCRPDSELPNDAMLALICNVYYEGSRMLKRPIAPGPFTAVRRDKFEEIGGYDEEHPFLEDQDFSQRMSKHGVTLHIIRETLYVWSLRRYRQQGTMKIMQAYAKAVFPILFFNKTPKNMTGYVMGGNVFHRKKRVRPSVLKKITTTLAKLMKEVFE